MEPISSRVNAQPMPNLDISMDVFDKATGLKGVVEKNISKTPESGVVDLVLKGRVVAYNTEALYMMAFKIMLPNLPLERDANGSVVLEPKSPLVKAKTHFALEMCRNEIIQELLSKVTPGKREEVENSIKFQSEFDNIDMAELLSNLKLNGLATQQLIDKAVLKVMGSQFDNATPMMKATMEKYLESANLPKFEKDKLMEMISSHFKTPQAMVQFVNAYLIAKKEAPMQGLAGQIVDALAGGHIHKAYEHFCNMPREERRALKEILVKYATQGQLTDFSVEINKEAERFHVDGEVVGGKPRTKAFWAELEYDRASMMKPVPSK